MERLKSPAGCAVQWHRCGAGFCQCASGYITAVGLEPGGKLFLGQAKGFPYTPNLLAYDKVICIVHAITPICTYIRTNFSLILAYCCGIIALILVQ